MGSKRKARSPTAQLEIGRSFYAGLNLEVGHFAAMWHSFNVGQLLANDLNAITRRHGISIADFHLLGALMIDAGEAIRAADLAMTLNVSAAVLSGRIARLERKGLLRRRPVEADRRATVISATPAGIDKVQIVGEALQEQAIFVRHYKTLPLADRDMLDRVMAQLHALMIRDFLPVSR